jgi:acyl-homoserine lactone acylase PvdQ
VNGLTANQSEFKDPRISRAVEVLRPWDLRSRADSFAFTYLYFWGKCYKELYSEAKFERFKAYNRNRMNVHSRKEQRMALTALTAALDLIQHRFGKTEVSWGDINVVVRGGTFPLDGADNMYEPLHLDGGDERPDGRIHCKDGWGHLMIVMEGQPKQVWSLLPFGQSENPASPHYNDQAKLHSQRQVKQFWLTPEEILANTESVWGDPGRIQKVN